MAFLNFLKSLGREKSTVPTIKYDKEKQIPVLKCSICNGEQVAGFKDRQTGHFTDVMLIRNPGDLEQFKQLYGIDDISKEY